MSANMGVRQFWLRQPLAFLGSVALLSLFHQSLHWHEHIGGFLDAFQSLTRPVWEFLFGWFFEWLDWKFPWWLKDYLTVGVVMAGTFLRAVIFTPRSWHDNQVGTVPFTLISMFYWPINVAVLLFLTVFPEELERRDRVPIVWETFSWVLIILVVNYALLMVIP